MSRLSYHRLRVAEIIEETHDARSLVFDIPPDLAKHFSYRPGQHLTLHIPCGERALPRCYSTSSSPFIDEPIRVTVKRVVDGRASNWVCDELRVGMELDVAAPAGVFVPKQLDGDFLLLAGGSGITPVFSILRSILMAGRGRIRLIYANRDERSVIFGPDLARLSREHPDRLQLIHWLDSVQGVASQAQLQALAHGWESAECFICGPAAFMDAAAAALHDLKVPHSRTHIERFVSLPDDSDEPPLPRPTGGSPARQVAISVTLDGQTSELQAEGDQLLIEAMEDAGLEPPYSCRAGACGACMCKLDEGEVELDENHVLDQSDLKQGWILTCQARARSDRISLSYPE